MSAIRRKFIREVLLTNLFFALPFFIFFAQSAQAAKLNKATKTLMLGETVVKINIYESKPAGITLFAPHYNERSGAEAAKEIIARKGGRLIEIESTDANGKPLRNLKFRFQDEFYSLDPNRIFTANGRKCSKFAGQIERLVKDFADDLLKSIASGAYDKNLPVIAVHNNQDVDEKDLSARNRDLTANAFTKSGAYEAQANGVYLSNSETDVDNFVFLSSFAFLSFFAERDFNVIVQKPVEQLASENCEVDDGSLSVYFGQKNIPYINLEADVKTGGFRQRQMLEAVYLLIEEIRKKSAAEKNNE